MGTLLDSINCGYELDPDKFQALCDSWLDRFYASNMAWNVLSPYTVNSRKFPKCKRLITNYID